MKEQLPIINTLKNEGLSKLDIDQVFNYLETLDYEIKNTSYIGQMVSKNERLAKYFFLRDQLKIGTNSLEKTSHINEILDQCIDWSEFWRLLVIKKGFCCIRLSGDLGSSKRFIFLSGPNILSGPTADLSDSIYDDVDC